MTLDKAQYLEASRTFCLMPWVHLHVNQEGNVNACCVFSDPETTEACDGAFGNVNRSTVAEIWDGEPMRAFRRTMIANRADPRCWHCYAKERTGNWSLRKEVNRTYAHHFEEVLETREDGSAPGSKPVYLDIRWSNVCNFKCRICNPWSSTSWFEDARRMGLKTGPRALLRAGESKDVGEMVEALVPHLEEIYFAGGEPLHMREHYDLIQRLIDRGKYDVYIRYNTNFSELSYKDVDVLALWKRFPRVTVSASLDGSWRRGEYQRTGQDWRRTLENRRRLMRECPHVVFSLSPTLSIFNLLHLPDLHREWVEQGLVGVCHFWINVLQTPRFLSIKVASPELKEEARRKYEAHAEWIRNQASDPDDLDRQAQLFLSAADSMDEADWSHLAPEFIEYTDRLDRLRAESLTQAFPELREFVSRYRGVALTNGGFGPAETPTDLGRERDGKK